MDLRLNDKQEILWITNISENFIEIWDKKVMIFEYLSRFEEYFLYDIIQEKWGWNFQLKIVKEAFNKDYIKENKFLDLTPIFQKKEKKYSIIINDSYTEKIGERFISEEDIDPFVRELWWNYFFYKHYIILNIKKEDEKRIWEILYDFMVSIKNPKALIRQLKKDQLIEYLFNDLNFPLKYKKDNIKNISSNNSQEPVYYKRDLIYTANNIAQKIMGFITIIENSFFYNRVNNISNDCAYILSNNIAKHDNYLIIGENYKGWLVVKWIPKTDFNVLLLMLDYLNVWDSITINFYSEERHEIKKERKSGVSWILSSKEKEKNEEKSSYIQILINFNDINDKILETRIRRFQYKIWLDFLCLRVVGTMSRYLTTYIWIWENKLNLERKFKNEQLRKKFIF